MLQPPDYDTGGYLLLIGESPATRPVERADVDESPPVVASAARI